MKTNTGWFPKNLSDAIGHEMKDNSGNSGELKNIYTDGTGWRFDIMFPGGLKTGLSYHDVFFPDVEWVAAAVCPECMAIRTISKKEADAYYYHNMHINKDLSLLPYHCGTGIIMSEGWTMYCPECNGRR